MLHVQLFSWHLLAIAMYESILQPMHLLGLKSLFVFVLFKKKFYSFRFDENFAKILQNTASRYKYAFLQQTLNLKMEYLAQNLSVCFCIDYFSQFLCKNNFDTTESRGLKLKTTHGPHWEWKCLSGPQFEVKMALRAALYRTKEDM